MLWPKMVEATKSQNQYMIYIENMWQELKMRVMGPKPTNLTHIEAFAK